MTFVPGNVFDPDHLSIVPPFTAKFPPITTAPDLSTLVSLNPLCGHVSAIFVSSFFHLFPGDAQLRAARAVAGLLSPAPGSMIFGKQIGLPEDYKVSSASRQFRTPQSWSELWDGEVFPKGTVRVLAFVTEVPKDEVSKILPEAKFLYMLTWSVTRL